MTLQVNYAIYNPSSSFTVHCDNGYHLHVAKHIPYLLKSRKAWYKTLPASLGSGSPYARQFPLQADLSRPGIDGYEYLVAR